MNNDEARVLAKQLLGFSFHQALWYKKLLENSVTLNDVSTKITSQQLHILWSIHKFGFNTLPMLSSFLQTSKSSLSITISKMVKEGYLCKKSPDADDDGRKIYFYVTKNGKDVLNSVERQIVDSLALFCRSLTHHESQRLDACMKEIQQIFK